MALVFDIEANGFLWDATEIHCICIYDTTTEIMMQYHNHPSVATRDGTLDEGLERLRMEAGSIIGHNITGFDIPLLAKLTKTDLTNSPILVDTFIQSCLLYPDIVGGHSLEAWAKRQGYEEQKKGHEDWTTFSKEMLERCRSDVLITYELYKELKALRNEHLTNHKVNWDVAIRTEQKVALIHAQQTLTGVRFNVMKAKALLDQFNERMQELEDQILKDGPVVKEKITGTLTINEPFKKDTSLKAAVEKYFEGSDQLPQGPYSKVSFRPLNINSPVEVKGWLLKEGWKPSEWTDKGSPKLTEDLIGLEDSKVGLLFKELNVLKHRRNFLLNKNKDGGALTKVRGDGRVPAEALTCATPTARYRHGGAVCNIPRPGTPYGEDIRSLFCVPEGSTMIGADLKGIEARMMAHYCSRYPGGKEIIALVLSTDKGNDFHTHNANVWGVSRDIAKSGLYALKNQRI